MEKTRTWKKCKYFNKISVLCKDKKQKYLLGRKNECDVVINDPCFSREQATFTFNEQNKSWYIKDGGNESLSRTGTW